MTRLQKMLSQIKTVEELSHVLGISASDIVREVGVSIDEERLINCPHEGCTECGFRRSQYSECNAYSMTRYLNAEIPETARTNTASVKTTSEHAPIIKLRDSARELLKAVVLEGFNQGHSVHTVYHHLDEYIDVLEIIGLFEKNELRTYVATDLHKVLINTRRENCKCENQHQHPMK